MITKNYRKYGKAPSSTNKDVSKFKRYAAEIDSYGPQFYEDDNVGCGFG